MNTRLAALALIAVIAISVTAIYALNQYSFSDKPNVTPSPTEPPIQSTPTDQNSTTIACGRFNTTYPTELTIVSPLNMTQQTSNVILKVNVTTSFWVISSVYYKADWLGDYHRLYSMDNQPEQGGTKMNQAITLIANFTGVPDGNHTIEVVANYHDYSHTYGAVNFTVGT
jgi:hypothetical protein